MAMRILEALIAAAPDVPVAEHYSGIFSSLVITGAGAGGVASTLRDQLVPGSGPHQGIPPGPEDGWRLPELAEYAKSDILLRASLGMAALNAGCAERAACAPEKNARELLREMGEANPGQCLAMIGHFPFLAKLSEVYERVLVFEKRPQPGDFAESDIPRYLPDADVVAITGTALTNHSLEAVLGACSGSTVKMLLGPSVPMQPLLFEYGIDILCGSAVVDAAALRDGLLRALPFRKVAGLRPVCLLREDTETDEAHYSLKQDCANRDGRAVRKRTKETVAGHG